MLLQGLLVSALFSIDVNAILESFLQHSHRFELQIEIFDSSNNLVLVSSLVNRCHVAQVTLPKIDLGDTNWTTEL